MKVKFSIPQSTKLIFKTYLLVLSIFTIFRLILFFTETGRVDFSSVSLANIIRAFVMGVRFDIVISGYILLFPALVLFVLDIINKNVPLIRQILFYWIFVLFTIAFIISSADIPYFNQFYDRFSIGAFEWIENFDFVVSMIIQEPRYFLVIIPFLILTFLFFYFLRKIFKTRHQSKPVNWGLKIGFSIFVLFIMFIGIRGRIEKKSPIRIGTAYFSDNSFLNKLGLNPVFTLMRSYLDSQDPDNATIKLMDETQAIALVQEYLNIQNAAYDSPVARKMDCDSSASIKPNIVIVIMESMSAAKMTRHGNPNNLTPFLDSLSGKSIYFENFYTAGKHTFNGVFSTLFSFPALLRQHPMKEIMKYDGISSTLLANDYTTTYFTTHDSQFDNVEGFFRANGFQNIISQADFPASEIKTTLGVPDDYLFRYSIPVLNEISKKGKPFFATFMTASDHGPFYIPEYFTPKSSEVRQQIVEYADWSLQRFITLCSQEAWFDNTIFVFTADHGAALDAKYDIALNYFHSPLIFFAPEIFHNDTVYKNMASQIDVYPTLMGMIQIPYINNTLGIDLINEKRKYALINDDDKTGILDTSYFCILKNMQASLYQYHENNTMDVSEDKPELVSEMTDYAKAHLQVYQNMILKKQTTLHKKKQE